MSKVIRCVYCRSRMEVVKSRKEIRYFCPKGCTERESQAEREDNFYSPVDDLMRQNPELAERSLRF